MENLMSFCPSCGEENSTNARFCSGCGEKLFKVKNYNPPSYGLNLSDLDEIDTVKYRLIDNNTEYYLRKFEYMDATETSLSWNWAAFFLGMYWMIFRKMYVLAAVIYGVNIFLAFLTNGSGILNLISSILIGCFGNVMYKDKINKSAKEALEADVNTDQFYKKKGGTNSTLAIVLFIALNLLSLITYMI